MGMVLYSLGIIVKVVLNVLIVLLLAAVIASWIGDPNNPIVRLINSITNPMLKPLRPLTDKIPGGIDWAPAIACLIIVILYQILVPILFHASSSIG